MARKLRRTAFDVVLELAAREQIVLAIDHIVKARNVGVELVFLGGIEAVSGAVQAIARREVVSGGIGLEHVKRRLIGAGRIVETAGEFGRTDLDHAAGLRNKGSNAVANRIGGYRAQHVVFAHVAAAFVVAEDEKLVLLDRRAEARSKDVTVQFGSLQADLVVEERIGVGGFVA